MWTVGGKLFAKSLDFVALLVLARFLNPSDFGLVAMAMTAVQIVEALSEMPLAAVLLTQRDPTRVMYDTAFTLALMRSILIVAVLSALSWPLSIIYHEPRLIPLQCALAFAPAMRGLVSQRMVEFTRHMDFRREVMLEVVAKAGALIVSVCVAVTTGSYWAIAVGTVSTTTIMALSSYLLAPQRLRLCLSQWHLFTDMVGWNAAGQVLSAVNWQTDKLVLPRFVDAATFGRFTSADTLMGIPFQAVILPIIRPLFSAFVTVRESGGIDRVYLKASAGIFSIAGIIFLTIAMLSTPIIHIVMGPKWAQAAPILTWLGFIAIVNLPAVVLPSLSMALNRTGVTFARLCIEFIVKVPLAIVLGAMMQVKGVLIGHSIASVAIFFSAMWLVKRLTGLPVLSQMRVLFRPAAAMVPAAVFLYEASKRFSAQEAEIVTILNLTWMGAAGLAIFVLVDLILWRLSGCPDAFETFAVRMVRRTLGRFLKV